ncbi:SagB/ThcOx family dehydrogenase [Actinomadura logoneensis]|uniref:SagB/ThcOx family dehydrogenase n=1 Tax=Actinomadura logoneensis TaxID=2293572 RepID=A0A372JU58_9ACTN|nr:SagB/ThcOx family dehydrogenase [Actinomadura logoneensis]RFU43274.1 SagB/ThcOx family dehydrogenase [Actinomadura logoneensis]
MGDPLTGPDAAVGSALKRVRPSITATGLATHPVRYESGAAAGHRTAEEFLVGSRLRRGDAELGGSVAHHLTEEATALSLVGRAYRPADRYLPLPPSAESRMELGEAVRRRRSVRAFTGASVDLPRLAALLRAGGGHTRHPTARGVPRRSPPSGGALYPVDLHVAALRIGGLDPGIYLHDPYEDALTPTGPPEAATRLSGALAVRDMVDEEHAAAVFLLVARPWRSMRKYGDRGMRYVLLEAGAIAQNINLVAVALGLGTVDCGSFYDDEAHEALEVDGLYRALVHAVILGVPTDEGPG